MESAGDMDKEVDRLYYKFLFGKEAFKINRRFKPKSLMKKETYSEYSHIFEFEFCKVKITLDTDSFQIKYHTDDEFQGTVTPLSNIHIKNMNRIFKQFYESNVCKGIKRGNKSCRHNTHKNRS